MKYGNALQLVAIAATLLVAANALPQQPPARRPAVGESVTTTRPGVVPTCRLIVIRSAPAPQQFLQPAPQIIASPPSVVGPDPTVLELLRIAIQNQRSILDQLAALRAIPRGGECPGGIGSPIVIDGAGLSPSPGSSPISAPPPGSSPPVVSPEPPRRDGNPPEQVKPQTMPPAVGALPPSGYQQYAVWVPKRQAWVPVRVYVVYRPAVRK